MGALGDGLRFSQNYQHFLSKLHSSQDWHRLSGVLINDTKFDAKSLLNKYGKKGIKKEEKRPVSSDESSPEVRRNTEAPQVLEYSSRRSGMFNTVLVPQGKHNFEFTFNPANKKVYEF